MDTVHVNSWIKRINLSVLPLSALLFDCVGDFKYQRGAISAPYISLNVATISRGAMNLA